MINEILYFKIRLIIHQIMHFYENREVISIMGENAQQKAHNFFSWNNYGEKMYDFYKKILLKDN